MRAELTAVLDQAGAGGRAETMAAAWARHFAALVSAIGEGAPWRSTDELNAASLAEVLRDGPPLPPAAVQQLALAGHRLRPWPDSRDALRRLAGRFAVVALSNGNLSMLTDLFAAGGLTWHCVLSGEMVHAYKPDRRCTGSRWTGWHWTRTGRYGRRPPLGPARGRRPRAAHRVHSARR